MFIFLNIILIWLFFIMKFIVFFNVILNLLIFNLFFLFFFVIWKMVCNWVYFLLVVFFFGLNLWVFLVLYWEIVFVLLVSWDLLLKEDEFLYIFVDFVLSRFELFFLNDDWFLIVESLYFMIYENLYRYIEICFFLVIGFGWLVI